jgi:hypothetical protein
MASFLLGEVQAMDYEGLVKQIARTMQRRIDDGMVAPIIDKLKSIEWNDAVNITEKLIRRGATTLKNHLWACILEEFQALKEKQKHRSEYIAQVRNEYDGDKEATTLIVSIVKEIGVWLTTAPALTYNGELVVFRADSFPIGKSWHKYDKLPVGLDEWIKERKPATSSILLDHYFIGLDATYRRAPGNVEEEKRYQRAFLHTLKTMRQTQINERRRTAVEIFKEQNGEGEIAMPDEERYSEANIGF